ncbi:hypothetical protein EV179_003939 [Coemansia sp. RSA 487]|nr:hypothetical protein EV179_003939 [Coemansia sp. RSA 487]
MLRKAATDIYRMQLLFAGGGRWRPISEKHQQRRPASNGKSSGAESSTKTEDTATSNSHKTDAREGASEGFDRGFDAGFRDGYRAGYDHGIKTMESLVQPLHRHDGGSD